MVNYTYIDNEIISDVLEDIINSKVIGLDTETTGLDPHSGKLRLIQIYTGINLYIIDLYKCNNWQELRREEVWKDKIIVGQSLRFELKWLWKYDIDISSCKNLFDLEIVSHVIYNGLDYKYSLKENLKRELGIEISKEEQVSDWNQYELTESQITYAANDVIHLLDCRLVLLEKIKKLNLVDILRIELKNIFVTASLEYNGIYLNVDEWEALIPDLEKELEQEHINILRNLKNVYYQSTFIKEDNVKYSVKLSSPPQLLKKLNEIGIPCKTTNKDELLMLSSSDYPVLKHIKKFKNINDQINKYLGKFRNFINSVTGRIHPSVFQLEQKTGRVSVKNPPMSTIPRDKKFRQAFKPQNPNNFYLDFDYSQIEARLVAQSANELKMLEIFNGGLDLYKATAAMEMNLTIDEWELLDDKIKKDGRQNAKSEALGLLYGMGVARYRDYCEQTFGIVKTEAQAKKERNRFLYKTYPGLPVWHKKCTLNYETKRELRNKNNRLYQLEQVIDYNLHINYPIQSLGTDIIKEALNRIFFFLKQKTGKLPLFDRNDIWLVAYVHDQGTFEGTKEVLERFRKDIEGILVEVAREMTEGKVAIKVDSGLGKNWYDSH